MPSFSASKLHMDTGKPLGDLGDMLPSSTASVII
jgi:hypothetical protein